jgi:hypothetical protein
MTAMAMLQQTQARQQGCTYGIGCPNASAPLPVHKEPAIKGA